MTQTLDTLLAEPEPTEHALTYEALRGRDVHEAERLVDRFADELRKMTAEERVRASRYSISSYADLRVMPTSALKPALQAEIALMMSA